MVRCITKNPYTEVPTMNHCSPCLSFLRAMCLLMAVLLLPVRTAVAAEPGPDTQNLVFYEIFTGSFSDSTGDGIGDLAGVLNRLDYLNDGNPDSETSLGIQGIWLTPVFQSPSYHKYDVTDYYTIDPDFGTMEDLQKLIDGCHARGIRLILDLPLNHTGSSNAWFQKFQNARILHSETNAFYDWYSCCTTEEKLPGHTYYPIPATDFWYEGNFSQGMPELNFDNEAVREAALQIARFYLDMGVDGFRFDAAKYIYFGDNARSAAFWEWYTGELRAISPDIWMVAEVWDSDSVTDQYVSALNCFNFTLAQAEGLIASTAAAGDVNRYTAYVDKYLHTIRSRRDTAALGAFIANHDTDRAAGYLPDSNGRIRMAANLYILGPGAPFLYYGEEIGLRGSRGGASTDANRRQAMQWGDGDPVRDPAGADYGSQTDATVSSMMGQSYSLLHYYRRLIDLRNRHPEIAGGTYQALSLSGTKLGGFIAGGPGRRVLVLHNTTNRILTLDLAAAGLSDFTEISGFIGSGFVTLEDGLLTVEAQTSVLLI